MSGNPAYQKNGEAMAQLAVRPLHIAAGVVIQNAAPCSCIASDTCADCQRDSLRVPG